MNFNLVNYLYLFKVIIINQNNPAAVWLILLGMRNKKNWFLKKNINGVIGFCKWTIHIFIITSHFYETKSVKKPQKSIT